MVMGALIESAEQSAREDRIRAAASRHVRAKANTVLVDVPAPPKAESPRSGKEVAVQSEP